MIEDQASVSNVSVNPEVETTKGEVSKIKVDLKSPPLLQKRVAISSSEADDFDRLGISKYHLEDLMIEVNRYLLASGASLVYGGDLRPGGLTQILLELVDRYKFTDQSQVDRLISFLSFPLDLSLKEEEEAKYAHRITFVRAGVPDDLVETDTQTYVPPIGTENLFIWARSLTHMRELMEQQSDARIFIAGKSTSYKGKAPGILEELLISLKHKTPIYLVGSFGGAIRHVVDHLEGGEGLKSLLINIQSEATFADLFEFYKERNLLKEMEWPKDLLNDPALTWGSIAALNGLTVEENKVLSLSKDVPEIIYYILKGIVKSDKFNNNL